MRQTAQAPTDSTISSGAGCGSARPTGTSGPLPAGAGNRNSMACMALGPSRGPWPGVTSRPVGCVGGGFGRVGEVFRSPGWVPIASIAANIRMDRAAPGRPVRRPPPDTRPVRRLAPPLGAVPGLDRWLAGAAPRSPAAARARPPTRGPGRASPARPARPPRRRRSWTGPGRRSAAGSARRHGAGPPSSPRSPCAPASPARAARSRRHRPRCRRRGGCRVERPATRRGDDEPDDRLDRPSPRHFQRSMNDRPPTNRGAGRSSRRATPNPSVQERPGGAGEMKARGRLRHRTSPAPSPAAIAEAPGTPAARPATRGARPPGPAWVTPRAASSWSTAAAFPNRPGSAMVELATDSIRSRSSWAAGIGVPWRLA